MDLNPVAAAARRVPLEKPPSKADAAKVLRQQAIMRSRIGAHIKRLRLEAGLSIRALAMRADISSGYLSEIERPKPERSVTIDLLVRIAYHLGVDPAEFLSSSKEN
jgi:ribosome-binding protein aMBF1 (putative translation factor)